MKIVGGTYREVCQHPHWDALFGSGLRAAAALSNLSPGTELHTYGPEAWREDITASAAACRLALNYENDSLNISDSYRST